MKFGIIGFGNLGHALAAGLMKSSSAGAGDIYVCDNSEQARDDSKGEPYFALPSDDQNFVVANADYIFLTIKSNVFEQIAPTIDKGLLKDKTIISFMAGVDFDKLHSFLGDCSIVRAMPSLAIAACEGVIGYTACSDDLATVFHKLGYAFETAPENIEKVMAFASCGLGFAAYLIDAFASAGIEMGFSTEVSTQIATLTFKNAVDRGHFAETVKAVATPGGATEQGVLHLSGNGVPEMIKQAVQKAYERMA
ncbi:MAG: NAD(P)-binding domain-containing protein [Oscillospiraceae bacterium]|nr:NAD(P)-binding domain-containing protein [Oscillospiraceae bacterium]